MPRLHDPDLDPPGIPPDLEAAIRPVLDGSEKLIWAARPRPWRLVEPELAALGGGLGFTVLAGFWMTARVLPLALLSLAVGLGLMGRAARAWRRGRATWYALTDRRAIVRDPPGWLDDREDPVRSYPPSDLAGMRRSERPDGSGDLVFARREAEHASFRPTPAPSGLGFLGIGEVGSVERLVRKTLRPG